MRIRRARGGLGAQETRADRARQQREDRADEKCRLEAAVERLQRGRPHLPGGATSVRAAEGLASTARPRAPPIMNVVLTTPEPSPIRGLHSLIAASSTGLNAIPAPRPSSSMPGSTSAGSAPDRCSCEQRQPGRGAAAIRRPAVHGCRSASRAWPKSRATDSHDEVGRQERQPHLHRAVAEHELHVERRDEEPREHRRRPQHADHVRSRHVAQPEHAAASAGAERATR